MQLRTSAIVCAARQQGETSAIVRLMTPVGGLIAGFVAGGKGRHVRPVLIPGNVVQADLWSQSDARMPFARLELLESRGPWLREPLAAAAITWVTALTAATLPERQAYPSLYDALTGALAAICHGPSARGWLQGVLAYETLLLRELGYGGDARPASAVGWADQLAGYDSLGKLLERYLLADRRGDVMGARAMLRERLGRIG